MTEIVNMTAHPVNVVRLDGNPAAVVETIRTYEPSGYQFRLAESWRSTGYTIDGVEVVNRTTGDLILIENDGPGHESEDLHRFGMVEGRYYIVSAQVLNDAPDRPDFICPAFVQRDGPAVLGCLGFSTLTDSHGLPRPRCWREGSDGTRSF